jgi:phosphoglycolate phosphatase
MTQFPFDIVGFDLDGTLIDTSEDLRIACNHALALGSIGPLSPAQIRGAIGGGARNMLMRGIEANGSGPVTDDLFEAMFDAFLVHYQANIAVHSRPFPGAIEALDSLDALGVKVAIVTNKAEPMADILFRTLGLRDRFTAFLGGDTLGRDKAKPAPDLIHEMIRRCGGGRAAFVGDSHFDIQAARNAGIPSVACAFGFLSGPIAQLGADAVIDHFDDLIGTLTRVGSESNDAKPLNRSQGA